MLVWRRNQPEFDPTTKGRWKTLPAKLTDADRRDFGVEREDEDAPSKAALLERFAPLDWFRCGSPEARKSRKELVAIIRAIRERRPLPPHESCCRQGNR
jgi:hypothetical protein